MPHVLPMSWHNSVTYVVLRTLLIGNGDGSFKSAVTYAADADDLSVADFDSDGVLDIVSASSGNFDLKIFISNTQEASAVSDIEVLSQDTAQDLIGILDNTVEKLTNDRSALGVINNRLDQVTVSNLTRQESLSSAQSLIEDTDFALETAELVKQQVMQQAQVAVQGQANTQLQVVLSLLQFN